MWQKFIKTLCLLGGVLIVMIQTPCSEAVSNFSTYIPSFILQNLPSLIQKKQFDTYILIFALVLVIFPFATFFLNYLSVKLRSTQYKQKTSLRTQKSLIIKSIMMDLEYSIPRYKNFYEKYNFNEPSVNIIFYVDELLEIMQLLTHSNKSNTLLDIETLFSYPEAHKINQYYNKSRNLISWLKLAKKVMSISIEDDEFIKHYKLLNISHQKQQSDTKDLITVDPIVDYKIYMQSFYIPEIKKLKNTAEQLMQMLNSKHTT